jgi:DNA-binding CsgD family transcriptional regulator
VNSHLLPDEAVVLTLSSADLKELEALLARLHDPFAKGDPDAWRRSVNRKAKSLLGMDAAWFMLPLPGVAPLWTECISPEVVTEYLTQLATDDPGQEERRRLGLDVCSHSQIYPDHRLETKPYVEFFRRYGLNDGLVVHGDLPDDRVAWIGLFSEEGLDASSEKRALAILRLLSPSFRAGVRAWERLSDHHASLGSVVDGLRDGIALFDAGGLPLHANPSLLELLEADAEGELLGQAIQEIAGSVAAIGSTGDTPRRPGVQDLRTASGIYRLQGSWVGVETVGRDRTILVLVERKWRTAERIQELGSRFGLTRRQSQVALLLGEGLGAKRIAVELTISWHTARSHIEHVLRKLGVRSKAEVPRILNGGKLRSRGPAGRRVSTAKEGQSPPRKSTTIVR